MSLPEVRPRRLPCREDCVCVRRERREQVPERPVGLRHRDAAVEGVRPQERDRNSACGDVPRDVRARLLQAVCERRRGRRRCEQQRPEHGVRRLCRRLDEGRCPQVLLLCRHHPALRTDCMRGRQEALQHRWCRRYCPHHHCKRRPHLQACLHPSSRGPLRSCSCCNNNNNNYYYYYYYYYYHHHPSSCS